MRAGRPALVILALACGALTACDKPESSTGGANVDPTLELSSAAPAPQRANPASERCVETGGRLQIERRPDGGEYGVCTFEDNRQCEEWALLRGHCPAGGLKVTGYVTAAARYCAITGGTYAITARSGSVDEGGNCTLPDARVCDAADYYAGTCPR